MACGGIPKTCCEENKTLLKIWALDQRLTPYNRICPVCWLGFGGLAWIDPKGGNKETCRGVGIVVQPQKSGTNVGLGCGLGDDGEVYRGPPRRPLPNCDRLGFFGLQSHVPSAKDRTFHAETVLLRRGGGFYQDPFPGQVPALVLVQQGEGLL